MSDISLVGQLDLLFPQIDLNFFAIDDQPVNMESGVVVPNTKGDLSIECVEYDDAICIRGYN